MNPQPVPPLEKRTHLPSVRSGIFGFGRKREFPTASRAANDEQRLPVAHTLEKNRLVTALTASRLATTAT